MAARFYELSVGGGASFSKIIMQNKIAIRYRGGDIYSVRSRLDRGLLSKIRRRTISDSEYFYGNF